MVPCSPKREQNAKKKLGNDYERVCKRGIEKEIGRHLSGEWLHQVDSGSDQGEVSE